ncbi:MAG: CerR family C-terminal domain-containing protein [Sedimentisphaerales bacterium]|nr:CerR family C-terminal domain-containing protein [Sedimentisphaerales bacterium]
MAYRKDGIDTHDKLLEVASIVFAEKGYRDTTVAEICRLSHSNVAAVNYHFGGKDKLYEQVWRNAFAEAIRVYPPDGGLEPDAPPSERLHALIYSLLHRILDDGRLGYAGKILLQEMADPTEVIRRILQNLIRPLRQRTRGIIKELLGPDAIDKNIDFCLMSVIHQCLAMGFLREQMHPPMFKTKVTEERIDDLVDHITRFSLAGIAATREEKL